MHQLRSDLRLDGTLTASSTQLRSGTTEQIGAGQTLQSVLGWTKPLRESGSLHLAAGPTLGVLEREEQGIDFAYGALGQVRAERPWGASRAVADYQASYQVNVNGVEGWALRQRLEVSLDGRMGDGWRYRGSIFAIAERQYASAIGNLANRTAELRATASRRWLDVVAVAGWASGVSNPFGTKVGGDGFFLQPNYDISTRYVSLQETTRFARNLSLMLFGRYALNQSPGRETGSEVGTGGVLAYDVGLIRLSVDEQYTSTEYGLLSMRENRLIVMASRSFGARF